MKKKGTFSIYPKTNVIESDNSKHLVDVSCGMIGLPLLMAPPAKNIGDDLFDALCSTPELIGTVPVRAAIEYKWETFGKNHWIKSDVI